MAEDINYEPDEDEIESAIVFMNSCSESDLIDSWNKIASEWTIISVVSIHKSLCESGRINTLLKSFES